MWNTTPTPQSFDKISTLMRFGLLKKNVKNLKTEIEKRLTNNLSDADWYKKLDVYLERAEAEIVELEKIQEFTNGNIAKLLTDVKKIDNHGLWDIEEIAQLFEINDINNEFQQVIRSIEALRKDIIEDMKYMETFKNSEILKIVDDKKHRIEQEKKTLVKQRSIIEKEKKLLEKIWEKKEIISIINEISDKTKRSLNKSIEFHKNVIILKNMINETISILNRVEEIEDITTEIVELEEYAKEISSSINEDTKVLIEAVNRATSKFIKSYLNALVQKNELLNTKLIAAEDKIKQVANGNSSAKYKAKWYFHKITKNTWNKNH